MKKVLALLMALAMLMMPLASLAESGKATTVTLNVDLSSEVGAPQGIIDLINVLGVRTVTGDDTFLLEILLSNEAVITFTETFQSDLLLLGSNLLGNETIGITGSDISNMLGQMFGYGSSFSLDNLIGGMSASFDLNAIMPDVVAAVDAMVARSPKTSCFLSMDGADLIVSYREIQITAQDVKAILEGLKTTVYNNQAFAYGITLAGGSANSFIQQVDEIAEEIDMIYAYIDAPVLTIGYNNADEAVYAQIALTLQGQELASYQQAIAHGAFATNKTFTVGYLGNFVTLKINESFAGSPSALRADSHTVYPLQMSSNELSSWSQGLAMNAQTVLFSIIYKLPASTLQMIMGAFSNY